MDSSLICRKEVKKKKSLILATFLAFHWTQQKDNIIALFNFMHKNLVNLERLIDFCLIFLDHH